MWLKEAESGKESECKYKERNLQDLENIVLLDLQIIKLFIFCYINENVSEAYLYFILSLVFITRW